MNHEILSVSDVRNFITTTKEYVGKLVDSNFNKMYGTINAQIPNNNREISLFADPTGSQGLLDIISIQPRYTFNNNDTIYIIEPDIWIGEISLFDEEDLSSYNGELNNKDLTYFIVLRRLGIPSVNYCVKNRLDNVYLIHTGLIKYYYELLQTVGYQTLDPKILDKEYVDKNYFHFNILKE
jgi:hypothetical protein